VELGHRSYTIIIRRGALSHADEYMQLRRKVLIVTDSGVPAQYAAAVAACCSEPVIVTVDQGEGSKNLQNFIVSFFCANIEYNNSYYWRWP
jgi:3-dehydroquinate synthase